MWSAENRLFPLLIKEPPHRDTGIIVVVPAYNEPGITTLLGSLASCRPPECMAEVLVVINAPPDAPAENLKNNITAVQNISKWVDRNKTTFFKLFVTDIGQPPYKKWGVGMARKTGMDEAFSRFQSAGNMNGVIVSLDADCTVENNYLREIEDKLLLRNDRKACSVFFEHPLEGKDYPEEIYRAVTRYELHLRYYYQALKYTGYPWVYHTIGSCMAVKAGAYARAGGMNRRQAGEDFYFIQKLLPSGGYFYLNSTTVYPSPRVSGRVPFGTGAAVNNMIIKGEDSYLTYNPEAFKDLRIFFRKVTDTCNLDLNELCSIYVSFPPSVRKFVEENVWKKWITEIKLNTSSSEAFIKRFFSWFNMFRIIKYLNYVHGKGIFLKKSPDEAAEELLLMQGKSNIQGGTKAMVEYFRSIERMG